MRHPSSQTRMLIPCSSIIARPVPTAWPRTYASAGFSSPISTGYLAIMCPCSSTTLPISLDLAPLPHGLTLVVSWRVSFSFTTCIVTSEPISRASIGSMPSTRRLIFDTIFVSTCLMRSLVTP